MRTHLTTALLAAVLALLALAPGAAARTIRTYEAPVDAGRRNPRLAVDQSNGDLYAASSNSVRRFDASGAPKNFTAGPDAGTNVLTGFTPAFGGRPGIAIDNSGGPLDGSVYVADPGAVSVKVFAPSGAPLGALKGSSTPAGQYFLGTAGRCFSVAVDQSNGDLYIAAAEGGETLPIWRYSPASPAGAIDDADYTLQGGVQQGRPCDIAADSGAVYAVDGEKDTLLRYAVGEFTPSVPTVAGAEVAPYATAVAVDPGTGDIYGNRGNGVAVYDSSGASLYEFGAASYSGIDSRGIAVKSAVSGPAEKAYVADSTSSFEVDVFGAFEKVPTYTHDTLASFGPDGTGATRFGGPAAVAFDRAAGRLYALDYGNSFQGLPRGLYGFDASAPPVFSPLAGYEPLATEPLGTALGLAVDNTELGSAGNVYFPSRETDLLYGLDEAGAPLAGFPVDPASEPGGPEGSPTNLCGSPALDSEGNVWVSNTTTERVLKYTPAGAYAGSVDVSANGESCHLALDSGGDLYAAQEEGLYRYTAASAYTTATRVMGRESGGLLANIVPVVDPTDDHLHVAAFGTCGNNCKVSYQSWVGEFDPAGNLVEEYPARAERGIALDPGTGIAYLLRSAIPSQITALGLGYLLPETRAQLPSPLANATATLRGAVNTQALALGECRFEYVTELAHRASGFGDLSSGGEAPCEPEAGSIPADLDEHPVAVAVAGLDPNTTYRFRLVAGNENGQTTAQTAFTTTGPPEATTAGAPIRTTTTARLSGRVNPVREPTTYRFEYGTQGPCGENPCETTPERSAGQGDLIRHLAENLTGLLPDTTYHYRLVAENGNEAGPAYGEDMTVMTRASDELAGQDERFPGPPGSDRAWELVSLPDSGGNPAAFGQGFSDDGNRAIYSIAGGTPLSNSGSFFSLYHSERPAGEHPSEGWQTKLITPAREDLVSADWGGLFGAGDLSRVVSANGVQGRGPIWRMEPGAAPTLLFKPEPPKELLPSGSANSVSFASSADGSRVVASLKGGVLDPAHPAAGAVANLYDVSTGSPKLVSILPGGGSSPCPTAIPGEPNDRWISEDGSRVYFTSSGEECSGPARLYVRDVAAATTTRVSPAPLSGPECSVSFLKGTPEAVFFTTQGRLVAADAAPANCAATDAIDIYRYELGSEALECLTCVAGGSAGVNVATATVADDGSRVYFTAQAPLLPGGAGAYRLRLPSGELDKIPGLAIGGKFAVNVSDNGAWIAFSSDDTSLNPLGGTATNGGTDQYYLYSDADGSLTCVSCPRDGSAPTDSVSPQLFANFGIVDQVNNDALAEDGTLGFATPTPLLAADQNTPAGGESGPGIDIYEYRDGRLLLVTDGLTQWLSPPLMTATSPGGSDIFFLAAAQYTPDAIDANRRLYDARIGGGIDFPAAAKACPLEVCQGTPKGAPEEQEPASATAAGRGNPVPAPRSCAPASRAAKRLARAAKRLRRAAARSSSRRRSRALGRRAKRLGGAAKRRRAAARRCRQANRNLRRRAR